VCVCVIHILLQEILFIVNQFFYFSRDSQETNVSQVTMATLVGVIQMRFMSMVPVG